MKKRSFHTPTHFLSWLAVLIFVAATCYPGAVLAAAPSQAKMPPSGAFLPAILRPARAAFQFSPEFTNPGARVLVKSLVQAPVPEPHAPTPVPTYVILRGEVLQRSNCRYGPGYPYLYKYGLVVGSNLEVIGRNEAGTWILVQAIGGNNPCWVKADLMAVKGEVMSVAPTYFPLPQSPYYGPPTGVSAARQGSEVTVFWDPFTLRAGDETASPPFLVEAWVCVRGELLFTPVGSYQPAVELVDEPGCAEASHGRVFIVEKHGYSHWVEVPWPGQE